VDGVRGCNIENVGLILVVVELLLGSALVVAVEIVLGDSASNVKCVDLVVDTFPFVTLLVLVGSSGSLGINVMVVVILGGRCDGCVLSLIGCRWIPSIACTGGGFLVSVLERFVIPCLGRRASSLVRVVSGGLDKPLFGAIDLDSLFACALFVVFWSDDATLLLCCCGAGFDVPVV
jgi:hypothetical protein